MVSVKVRVMSMRSACYHEHGTLELLELLERLFHVMIFSSSVN